MFKNNPLLSQLKQQIRENLPQVEGIVKASDKAFGFLESDKKSYFIPPQEMKKLMHGDKIRALIHSQDDKEYAEPIELITPMLSRFIARIGFNKDNKLQISADHPQIKQWLNATISDSIQILPQQPELQQRDWQQGDWVVAELSQHPLADKRPFSAQITEFICPVDDYLAPWWVTLARHQQSRYPVTGAESYPLLDQQAREDLSALHFITIDSASTEDMDDALYIEPILQENQQIGWRLVVAIADPTAYIALDSQIEQDAKQRCFTHYLPGFNIPMLPRELSDQICSLKPLESRPALVCYIEANLAGEPINPPKFVCATIQSKAKLDYQQVSDYLEQLPNAWQPDSEEQKQQIDWLHQFSLARNQWRKQHALLFNESCDYQFVLGEQGQVTDICAKPRRLANQIVEEAMIIANICAAQYLNQHLHTGIFNTHIGFDNKFLASAHNFLINQLANPDNFEQLKARYSEENLQSLDGYCQMRRDIEEQQGDYLEHRLRRMLSFAEFKSQMAPHLGLGLKGYATWTSPIRKYSDMMNHRLIKASLFGKDYQSPSEQQLQRLQEARRQSRMIERDIADWLYCRYLVDKLEQQSIFEAKIMDVSRGGLRAQLLENGALVFIPAPSLGYNKEELSVNTEELALYIKGERGYKIGDKVKLQLTEVREQSRSIIGQLVTE